MRKQIALLLCIISMLSLLSSCGGDKLTSTDEPPTDNAITDEPPTDNAISKDNIPPNCMYDSSLGVAIHLGMSKLEVDAMYGEPVEYPNAYTYAGESLWIHYAEGKVSYISSDNKRFLAVEGIHVGTPESTLKGVLDQFLQLPKYISFFANGNKIVIDAETDFYDAATEAGAEFFVDATVADGVISNISIMAMDD